MSNILNKPEISATIILTITSEVKLTRSQVDLAAILTEMELNKLAPFKFGKHDDETMPPVAVGIRVHMHQVSKTSANVVG